MKDYHISLLHPFDYNPEITDPRQIANKDQHLTDIEAASFKSQRQQAQSNFYYLRQKIRWK